MFHSNQRQKGRAGRMGWRLAGQGHMQTLSSHLDESTIHNSAVGYVRGTPPAAACASRHIW